MIVKEQYIKSDGTSLWRIYSNTDFFLQLNNQLLRDGYVNNDEEIQEYKETNIPLPPIIATSDFITNTFVHNRQLTQRQILAAAPIIEHALNQLSDEEVYEVSFLYNELQPNKEYQIGERFQYQNQLYTTIQTGLGRQLFTNSSADYFHLTEKPAYLIDEWQINHIYQQTEKVRYGTHIYQSLLDNNMWSPQDFPAAWELIE